MADLIAPAADQVRHATTVSPSMEGRIAADLRDLADLIARATLPADSFCPGDSDYGVEYVSDLFAMHPFFWGECSCSYEAGESAWLETNSHSIDCYQNVIRDRGFIDLDDPRRAAMSFAQRNRHNDRITRAVCRQMGLNSKIGTHSHCTCTYAADYQSWLATHSHDDAVCGVGRPNFLHKASGTRVDFYKRIGRGMVIDLRGDWAPIIAQCRAEVASLDRSAAR